MSSKKINLSVYSLPRTFYVKYNILAIYVIASINVTAMFFIWCIRQKIFDDSVGFSITFLITVFSIYTDLDALHGLMKKQFIEVTDKYIRIKKLNSDITLNWHEIKSVEEIYNVKFHNLIGAKLKRRDKGKGILSNRDITISFSKYANIDIVDFFEVLRRKKR